MITSQNRPGLPDFSLVTLKNMGRPGDEAVYIDDLVEQLKARNIGTVCGECVVSSLLYADDIVLLAPDEESLHGSGANKNSGRMVQEMAHESQYSKDQSNTL